MSMSSTTTQKLWSAHPLRPPAPDARDDQIVELAVGDFDATFTASSHATTPSSDCGSDHRQHAGSRRQVQLRRSPAASGRQARLRCWPSLHAGHQAFHAHVVATRGRRQHLHHHLTVARARTDLDRTDLRRISSPEPGHVTQDAIGADSLERSRSVSSMRSTNWPQICAYAHAKSGTNVAKAGCRWGSAKRVRTVAGRCWKRQ